MKKTVAMLSALLVSAGLKAQNSPVVKKETLPQAAKTQNAVGAVADTSKLTNRNDKITTRFDKMTNTTIKYTDKPGKITKVIKGDQPVPDTVSNAIKITGNTQQLKNTPIEKNKSFKY